MIKKRCIRRLFLALGLSGGLAFAQLQIYMPRQIAITDGNLVLERIAVLNGDPNLVQQARYIRLGSLLAPGQQTIIDRPTILSRLASHQIDRSKVSFLGAQAISVRRTGTTIPGQEIADLAIQFFKSQAIQYPVSKVELISSPADITIDPNLADIRLSPRIVAGGPFSGSVRIRVSVIAGQQELTATDVLLRLLYSTPKVIANRDLSAGAVLGTQDIRIEQQTSATPPAPEWKAPYGRVLSRPVKAGNQIGPNDLERPTRQIAIKRNELVVIRIQRPGVLVTGQGKAMSDGRVGEVIKVRNIESNRIVLCQVKEDGSVEPVL